MSVIDWITKYRNSLSFQIEKVSLNGLQDWQFENGQIKRKDNAFFSIKAIRSDELDYELPLIDQPEIGILGFLLSQKKGKTKILLQAKSEPGNIHLSQIGPSVQATESNYRLKHKGKPQKYIEFFLNNSYTKFISLQQSEQGTRFLNKYNLNVIALIDEDQVIIDDEKYIWQDLHVVKSIFNHDFLFNTDFKSVFSHLLESIILEKKEVYTKSINLILNSYFNNTGDNIFSLLEDINNKRLRHKFNTRNIKLEELLKWEIDENGLIPHVKNSFGYNFFSIELDDREISEWQQPLITKSTTELIVLLCLEQGEELHFVFRERIEIGFTNYLQLGPTFQYESDDSPVDLENVGECLLTFSQSEEGGRFYQNISEYKIYKIYSNEYLKSLDGLTVLNLYQICQLVKIKGIFTNEARSLIASLVSFIPD